MITPIYAALLALLFIFLSFRTIKLRRRLGIAVGDNDNPEIVKAIRVHANFAEYVPFVLLLSIMLELMSASYILVHIICLALFIGRMLHAYGLSQQTENYTFRVFGMVLSLNALLLAALACFYYAVVAA